MLQLWMAVAATPSALPVTPPGGELRDAPAIIDLTARGRSVRAWIAPRDQATDCLRVSEREVVLRLGRGAETLATAAPFDPYFPWIRIDRRTGELAVGVPLTAVAPLFHAGGRAVLCIGTDPRLLRPTTARLDLRGVYGLLQFGALVPPHTLWTEVRRFVPGRGATLAAGSLQLRETPPARETGGDPDVAGSPPLSARARHLGALLDAILGAARRAPPPVVLFSGGVDSGLIAARAAALGWKDTLLVNGRLEERDPQADAAAALAAHLGLRCVALRDDPDEWGGMLAGIAREYPLPVGDYATVPSYRLARYIRETCPAGTLVLDGSGADAEFRTFAHLERRRRFHRVPRVLRRAAGACLSAGRWERAGRGARWLGVARISGQLPLPLGAIAAENPLLGIAYDIPSATREEVNIALLDWAASALPDRAPGSSSPTSGPDLPRAVDLLHVVCSVTAYKTLPPFLGTALDLVHPFLHPEMRTFAWRDLAARAGGEESKAVLKHLLAQQVPAPLVYRPKGSMTPRLAPRLCAPGLVSALEEHLLEKASPLSDVLRRRAVERLVRRARRGEPLSHAAANLLWSALAAASWLRAAGAAGRGAMEGT